MAESQLGGVGKSTRSEVMVRLQFGPCAISWRDASLICMHGFTGQHGCICFTV
jgi:hypothetical protein